MSARAEAGLERRYRLAPGATLDAPRGVLWVPRRNPLERLLAWLFHRGEARVALRLDATSLDALLVIAAGGATGGEVAARLGIEAAPVEASGRERLGALLVFLDGLVRGRALVAEPI